MSLRVPPSAAPNASVRLSHAISHDPSRYALNVPVFYAYRALVYFFLWMPIWFIYLQRMRGLTITQISVIGAIGWLASSVAQVPTGALADVVGRRLSLALGAFSYGIGILGYALVSDFWLIMLFDVIWTVGFAFITGADLALIYDSLKQDGREEEYARIAGRATAVMHGAQGLGSLLGAPLALLALNLPLVIAAAVAGMAGVVALRLREPPITDRHTEAPPQRGRYWGTIAAAWEILRASPSLRCNVLYYMAMYLPPFLLAYIFLQPYAAAHGVPVAWMGALVFGLRLVSVTGSALAHKIVEQAGERLLLYALPIAMVSACLAMVLARSLTALLFVGAVQLLGAVSLPFVTATLNRQIPSATRATVLSTASLVSTLGVAASQPLLGAVADRWGFGVMVGMLGAGIAVLAGGVLVLWHPYVGSVIVTRRPSAPTAHGP